MLAVGISGNLMPMKKNHNKVSPLFTAETEWFSCAGGQQSPHLYLWKAEKIYCTSETVEISEIKC